MKTARFQSSSIALLRDLSLSATVAGFITVLVGVSSSAVIVFKAAHSLGASPEQISSWVLALGLGMGLTCIGLSLHYRIPVVTAWSTPGAAMLIVGAGGYQLSDAVGAFMVSSFMTVVVSYSGLLKRVLSRIPASLAAGLLGGVLLRFGLEAFIAVQTQGRLVLAMMAAYFVVRRFTPRYAVIATLLAGIAFADSAGSPGAAALTLEFARPVFVAPTLSISSIAGIALPMFIVTMVSQNVPGVAALRDAGYSIPISPVIGITGITNLALAPFGAFALNLAAITGAICASREAHEDPARRYVAAIFAGVFYIVVGLFGATLVALLANLPKELVSGIAGIALLGTLGNSFAAAFQETSGREAALVTFLVTASGLTMAGIGSTLWGFVAGLVVLKVSTRKH